ncbi:inositol polyphosphate-4-phosphatase type I A-like isoform X2 [Ostrea edulis]|uniref:inositol polyphosphate-4-phosphatase type I A-like isoform X2 n=1 Tax=Ostrea edulis TaxID=37623 RepID=UPI0024AE9C6A|nr:inositol polyphosphate-4-phosphatase type I A-like isoform X2 [Ostrea edulis]
MRFNNKELVSLAHSGVFDKEGPLLMKDKLDGLFKKGEEYQKRYLRLKGNLLFYFKDKDRSVSSELPLGVLVIERCAVELDLESVDFGFLLVYEGEEYTYKFQAPSEEERDDWIQKIHTASYECLKMQLQSLREQIQAKTGRDPITQPPPTEFGMEFETQSGNANDDPALEICLSCKDLPNDINGQAPNPFIVLSTIVPPQQTWIQHSNTEVVEASNDPQFLKTIGFGDKEGVDINMRVKIMVYHVKERLTGTMSQLGHAIFTLQDVLMNVEMKTTLRLVGPDPLDCGTVTIMAWVNDTNLSLSHAESGTSPKKPAIVRHRSKRVDTLRPHYKNIITRTFRFDTTNGDVKLLVHEYMGESILTFDIPMQLLKLWIEEEKHVLSQLQDIGQLPLEYESDQISMITVSASIVSKYTDLLNKLSSHQGPCFKASVKKADKDLEFVPLNLHLQRMTVINEEKNTTGWYDMITVGAFTAYAQKYKHGGLSRLLSQLQDSYSTENNTVTNLSVACDLVNSIYDLKMSISKDCDSLCKVAVNGTGEELTAMADSLQKRVRKLVEKCETPLVQNTADEFNRIKEEMTRSSKKLSPDSDSGDNTNDGVPNGDVKPGNNWKWSGTDFVKSSSTEPWEMTRLNTEAAAMCLISLVDDLVLNKNGSLDRTSWLDEISPAVSKMKSFLEIVYQKILLIVMFLNIKESRGNSRLMHIVRYRRDVCFSHALTTLVSGFVTKLTTSISSEDFLKQLQEIGLFCQFEGLLSCHGDEMGMIEDYCVAIDDLKFVSFQFVKTEELDASPTVFQDGHFKSGAFGDFHRHCVSVNVPLEEEMFSKLPTKLQRGGKVPVTPVLFNIGINEQASLADKIGDTSLQERINAENVAKVFTYLDNYEQKLGSLDKGKSGQGTINDLKNKLHYNTTTKKSKNTDVLKLASEICRKIHGIRITSCKSAKDRTSMSVTLEQVYILQQEHDLASHVFTQALDCFRSEGVRRENTFKNIGSRKYAFNSFQLLYVPKLYRPPNGTYGNVQG